MSDSSRPDARRNASPYLYGQETAAVAQVLESGQYGHSDVTEQFERRVADFLRVGNGVAVASGTAALHLALIVAGAGPGDEVVVPSMTFCATVQAILAVGAAPRFIDIDPATLCVNPQLVMEAVTPRTAAVIPVHFAGRPVDLHPVHGELAERGIALIEDAAHAFGSHTGTGRVGSTGALTCFSFGPIKNLTCGQGGMVVPRTPQDADRLRRLRLLGIRQSQSERANSTSYLVDGFGLRYQLSSLNAAIGLVQLDHFAAAEHARRRLWRTYAAALAQLDGVTLVDVDVDHAVPHLCQIRVHPPHRDRIFAELRTKDIGVGVHYPPNHLQPAFARWRCQLFGDRTGRPGDPEPALPPAPHRDGHRPRGFRPRAGPRLDWRLVMRKLLTLCLGTSTPAALRYLGWSQAVFEHIGVMVRQVGASVEVPPKQCPRLR